MTKKVAIIGGGITGLTAGYRLAQKGFCVEIFEKDKHLGGLTKGFRQNEWSWSLENFYHHLFTNDKAAINLLAELQLNNKIITKSPKSSILYKNKIDRFDSAISLLRFPHLNLPEKLKTGLITFYLKITNNWKGLEKQTARDWLLKYYGGSAFKTLWEPLLKNKFSQSWGQISMAWFWARIKKRTNNLIYLQGGFQIIIDRLENEIVRRNGKINLNYPVSNLKELRRFDLILITAPAKNLAPIKQPEMLAALVLILTLKDQFLTDNTYWLNINEPGFPFLAVVEHTNFVDKKYYDNQHILYVGGYYPQDHRYLKMTKKQIFQEFLPYLGKINPAFNFQCSIIDYRLSFDLNAQPIIPTNYLKMLPAFKTKMPNVYLANMSMVYPWDRGINYAIKLGQDVAYEIIKSQE